MSVESGTPSDYPLHKVALTLCRACIDGVGDQCHTPGCALFLHNVDIPILPAQEQVEASHRVAQVVELPAPTRREVECGVDAGFWHMRHTGPSAQVTDVMSYVVDGQPVVYTGPGPEFEYTVAAMRERCLAGLAACDDAERLASVLQEEATSGQ